MRPRAPFLAVALVAAMTTIPPRSAAAQPGPDGFNYDESKVGTYTLPELLVGPDGAAVTTPEGWRTAARPRWLALLEAEAYGRMLEPVPVTAEAVERGTGPDGMRRVQARLRLGHGPDAPTTEVLLYLPAADAVPTDHRLPTFLHLNFGGNHAETADPAVRLPRGWVPNGKDTGVTDNTAREASRGTLARRWPVARLVGRGYATATASYADLFPDRADGRPASVLPGLGYAATDAEARPDEPGAIATWAWQLSRILDWLVTLPEIDPRRVIVVGHSRLGKTALWAGAGDERFAMVVSNESGCGGAALERRDFGETVKRITTAFPHWFCPRYAGWADRAAEMPFDQHVLLAMTAPRPLYVASAAEDLWADPRGEFLAAVAAEPAWRLFGRAGLGTDAFPAPDTPVGHSIGYHVRSVAHDIVEWDWERFADFADRALAPRP